MPTPPASDNSSSIPGSVSEFSARTGDEVLQQICENFQGFALDSDPWIPTERPIFEPMAIEIDRHRMWGVHELPRDRAVADRSQYFDDRMSSQSHSLSADVYGLGGLISTPHFRRRLEAGEEARVLQALARKKTSIPSACRGCANYFGETHGGNTVICGMYPYGPKTDVCEDFEAKNEA